MASKERPPTDTELAASLADIDIWRAAEAMIRQFGNTADFEAGFHAKELMSKGDLEGQGTWLHIAKTIDALQKFQMGEAK